MCETSCPPQQQEQGVLGTTDAKLHCCCCWCCSPVLLLLWFGHTYAHKNCASDLWVEGIHTHHVEGRTKQPRLRSKQALTSTVSQGQSAHSQKTTSYILLLRRFTATPARCWAALYGVGCLSVRAAKAVSLCVSRAPPLGMFVSCLGTRRDHSGRRRQ